MWLQKNESLSSPPSSPSLTHLKVYMESGTMVSEVDREVIHPPPCQQDLLHFQPVKGWQSVNAHHQKSEKLRLQRENLVGETPKTTRWKFTPTPPPSSFIRTLISSQGGLAFIYLLATCTCIYTCSNQSVGGDAVLRHA